MDDLIPFIGHCNRPATSVRTLAKEAATEFCRSLIRSPIARVLAVAFHGFKVDPVDYPAVIAITPRG